VIARRVIAVVFAYMLLLASSLAPVAASRDFAQSFDPLNHFNFCLDQVSSSPDKNKHDQNSNAHCTECCLSTVSFALSSPFIPVHEVGREPVKQIWRMADLSADSGHNYTVFQARAPPSQL
jgi:hypothetical protein